MTYRLVGITDFRGTGEFSEMTKDNIIIAALRLFLLRGYKYVSLVDVAGEAGITKGGIYHYFSGKDDLLHAAIHYLFDRFEARYGEIFAVSRSLRGLLEALIVERELDAFTHRLLCVDDHDCRLNLAMFALEGMKNFPQIRQRVEHNQLQQHKALEEKVRQAMEKGELRHGLDCSAIALIILALLNGQNALTAQTNSPEMRRQMMDNLWQLIAR